jgi:Protein of unknown function with HXXEE motif
VRAQRCGLSCGRQSNVCYGSKAELRDRLMRGYTTFMPSEIIGPAFLSVILAAAAFIAFQRRERLPTPATILPIGCVTVAIQAVHVAEEFLTGFQTRIPLLLGMEPWSSGFFVSFNLAWIALWSLALAAAARGRLGLPAMTALWFLGLAAVGNAIWHPALSLVTGGYFPGTLTALPLGVSGFLLVRRLMATATR